MASDKRRVVARITDEEGELLERLRDHMAHQFGIPSLGWGDVVRAGLQQLSREYFGEGSPVELRLPGRPRKEKPPDQPKRPRGRPRKE